MTRIAINGLGVIGRALVKSRDFEVVAVNEPNISEAVAALNASGLEASVNGDSIIVGNAVIHLSREENPLKINWPDVDLVVEASKPDITRADLKSYGKLVLMAGDLREGEPDLTYLLGVSQDSYRKHHEIICASSDRMQIIGPLLDVLEKHYGPSPQIFTETRREPYRVERNNEPEYLEGLFMAMPGLRGRVKGVRTYKHGIYPATAEIKYEIKDPERFQPIDYDTFDRFEHHLVHDPVLGKFFMLTRVVPERLPNKAVMNPNEFLVDDKTLTIRAIYDPLRFYINALTHIIQKVTS